MADINGTYKRFEELVEHNKLAIRRICMRRAKGDVEMCADMVQECYIELCREISKLRAGATPMEQRVWVQLICRRKLDALTRKNAPLTLRLNDLTDDIPADEASKKNAEKIDAMMEALNEDEVEFITLMREGLSRKEICNELKITQRTYSRWMNRITLKMRQYYYDQIAN